MKISENGKNLIKKYEGCKLEAYLCSAGKWTIGYGNTFYEDGKAVKKGDKITRERAESLFNLIVPKFEAIVNRNIKVKLTQNQFDALVSHTYNTGGSNTLFRLVNQNADDSIIEKWFTTKYVTANKVVLKGLQNRRKEESKLFFR